MNCANQVDCVAISVLTFWPPDGTEVGLTGVVNRQVDTLLRTSETILELDDSSKTFHPNISNGLLNMLRRSKVQIVFMKWFDRS